MESYSDTQASLVPKDKDTSYENMPTQEKMEAAVDIVRAALPNILSSFGALLKDVISLYFIGHLNKPIVFAAMGFGITWTNAFASAIIFGFAAGFGILASQAYGANNYYKLGLLYQKVLVVTGATIITISSILWFTEAELNFLGFEQDLAHEIGLFIRYLIPDLFCCIVFETTRFYLVAQNIFHVPAITMSVSTVLHIFWSYLFVNVLGMELVGMAIARTITDGTCALIVVSYVKIKNPCPESWFPWTRECLEELLPFAKNIASHGSSIYMEWIAFEMTTLIIGFLGDVTVLAAHVAALNYLFINSTISLGINLAMCVFIGNAAGEGSLRKVRKYAYTGLLVNLAAVTFLDIILFFGRDQIAGFYTEEETVKNLTISILTYYVFGMHADLCCNTSAYLLRSLGHDRFVLKGFIFCYYGIGVTSSLITGVFLGFGYTGVWMSLIGGCYIMLVMNMVRFFYINWEQEVHKIHNEMKRKSFSEENAKAIEMIKSC